MVDVAIRLFVEKGYDGTSIADIAEATGLAKSSIYHHVANKEELLGRALDRAIERLYELAVFDAPADAGPAAQLRAIVERVIRLAVDDDPHVMLARRLPTIAASVPAALERYRLAEADIAQFAYRAVESSGVRTDINPLLLNRLIWVMSTAVADVRFLDPSVDKETLVQAGLRFVFDGALPGID